ncbi:hypothetical protein EDD18DRAFT_1175766 [Armillaria luteobubalina]|uniref:CST complex subunit STN1 n=1 Tax=Armillaria luteobubalina TaxID=153913 RepID=A0AA39UMV8_9AGAR|nr:hypothetical protein EDD18DRAFT_1175766 [Armillaria luteobubalina]
MSMTTTTTSMTAPSSSSVFLTPRKKTATQMDIQPAASTSTLDAIHHWCVMQEEAATVLCFVRDIHAMTQTLVKDRNVFWIGKVPCRRVNFVGMIVGVQDTGKRIKITVDDGTAVIDCVPSSVMPPTPALSSSSKSTSLLASSTTIRIGHLVRVVGRVEERHDTKEIRFDSVEQCKSFNDEPHHWQKVSSLHKTYYSSPEPFVIPSATNQAQNQEFVAHMSQASINDELFSPVQEPQARSSSQSPQKFAHPSRLRSSQLTDNTFRLYLKYYMENPPHAPSQDMSDTDIELDATPRPRAHHLRMSSDMHGFTLSFLRRVPELSNMAKHVVHANIKRLRRQEREAAKASSQILRKSQNPSRESLGAKKKQLFIKALVDLMQEGSIVLWNGPNHLLSTTSLPGPWKSTSTQYIPTSVDISSTTATSTFMSILQDDDDDALSDPEPLEDSYVPLTPQYTADVVENAMVRMNALPPERRRPLYQKRITEFLRRTDDRWRNLGDWAVRDALELLRTEKRARLTSPKGPWELCL